MVFRFKSIKLSVFFFWPARLRRQISYTQILTSCQTRFRKVQVTLNTPQRIVVNYALISQLDDGLPFNTKRLALQTLILWRRDLAAAIVGVFGAKVQLLDALIGTRRANDPLCRAKTCRWRGAFRSIRLPPGWLLTVRFAPLHQLNYRP